MNNIYRCQHVNIVNMKLGCGELFFKVETSIVNFFTILLLLTKKIKMVNPPDYPLKQPAYALHQRDRVQNHRWG